MCGWIILSWPKSNQRSTKRYYTCCTVTPIKPPIAPIMDSAVSITLVYGSEPPWNCCHYHKVSTVDVKTWMFSVLNLFLKTARPILNTPVLVTLSLYPILSCYDPTTQASEPLRHLCLSPMVDMHIKGSFPVPGTGMERVIGWLLILNDR